MAPLWRESFSEKVYEIADVVHRKTSTLPSDVSVRNTSENRTANNEFELGRIIDFLYNDGFCHAKQNPRLGRMQS